MAASDREIIGQGWQGGQERDRANVLDAAGETRRAGPDAFAGWWKASDETRFDQRGDIARVIVCRDMDGKGKGKNCEKH